MSNHEKEIQELRERLPQTFSGADYIANYQLDLVAKIAYRGEALERWMQTGPVPLSKDVRDLIEIVKNFERLFYEAVLAMPERA